VPPSLSAIPRTPSSCRTKRGLSCGFSGAGGGIIVLWLSCGFLRLHRTGEDLFSTAQILLLLG
jgi:hypothetical protein